MSTKRVNTPDPTLIFCFGSELVKEDALALELADELQLDGFKFVKISRVEQLLEESGHLRLLDVVKGIDKVTLLTVDDLKERTISTLHDFDLQFFLKLMKSIGTLQEVSIIGLPYGSDKEKIKKELATLLIPGNFKEMC